MARVSSLFVIGTRPEAIKMAPLVIACLREQEDVHPIVCVTGQHVDMVAPILDYFHIDSAITLATMTHGQSVATLTARCLAGHDRTIEDMQPDCVVAQGDTSTVLAAAMAAFYQRVPFVHVEAGLRTYNLNAPWPEEFNRRVVALGAAVHCAPTYRAANTLIAEGVPETRVHVTGNTVIDALQWTIERERHSTFCAAKYDYLADRSLVLVTGHRRENMGRRMDNICAALAELARHWPNTHFVFPVHKNPQVQSVVQATLSGIANVHLLAPIAYPEFVWLMDRSTLILTDSGGIQEEAPALAKHVLVLRESTERPEALETGFVELVGTSTNVIVEAASRVLSSVSPRKEVLCPATVFGDGRAAERIVRLIADKAWSA